MPWRAAAHLSHGAEPDKRVRLARRPISDETPSRRFHIQMKHASNTPPGGNKWVPEKAEFRQKDKHV